jgi:response regulator RpfG family c-di-GMP phosphodiesterase
MLMNMLISTNIASIRLIKHIKNADKAKNKTYIEDIVQRIYTIKKNTRKVIKKIKYSDRRSTIFVIS